MDKIFDKRFWRDLRSETSVRGVGANRCGHWCYETLDQLVIRRVEKRFVMKDYFRGFEFARKGLWWLHSWIETPTLEGIFVADGTAGQIDASFSDGYYGLLEKAPVVLREIYTNGSPTC